GSRLSEHFRRLNVRPLGIGRGLGDNPRDMSTKPGARGGGRGGRAPRVTEEAIDKIRERIVTGSWGPGDRLPKESELAAELGLSRNSAGEAVRALFETRRARPCAPSRSSACWRCAREMAPTSAASNQTCCSRARGSSVTCCWATQ